MALHTLTMLRALVACVIARLVGATTTTAARLKRRARLIHLALTIQPIAGGAPDDDEDEEDSEDDDDKSKDDEEKDDEDSEDDDDKSKDDEDSDDDEDDDADKTPNWKRMSRKHEREAKKARRERDELQSKLQKRQDAEKSEHQKALDKARKEGEETAESKHAETRRADKIETSVLRLAAKGVKVTVKEDGKDVEKVLKFDDPEDAQVFIERSLARGDLDYDDVFEDGKVKVDALEEELADLLDRKPRLAASSDDASTKVQGSSDAGKGNGGKTSDEDMSVEDHLKKIRRHKK